MAIDFDTMIFAWSTNDARNDIGLNDIDIDANAKGETNAEKERDSNFGI
jgi:hypothetical protein